jgi:hypothetical protein
MAALAKLRIAGAPPAAGLSGNVAAHLSGAKLAEGGPLRVVPGGRARLQVSGPAAEPPARWPRGAHPRRRDWQAAAGAAGSAARCQPPVSGRRMARCHTLSPGPARGQAGHPNCRLIGPRPQGGWSRSSRLCRSSLTASAALKIGINELVSHVMLTLLPQRLASISLLFRGRQSPDPS